MPSVVDERRRCNNLEEKMIVEHTAMSHDLGVIFLHILYALLPVFKYEDIVLYIRANHFSSETLNRENLRDLRCAQSPSIIKYV